ncbi:hypothetical protein JKP88DRAFT_276295 [Tribonema minus]|uniref:Uncharacterized protein n=1 Tax=Tribonema minus TaxID=303371 RepID=A0A835Z5L5_9STRA|nr:hypothetical protein JKP88DRAFT_276295 [Tribonema minus]
MSMVLSHTIDALSGEQPGDDENVNPNKSLLPAKILRGNITYDGFDWDTFTSAAAACGGHLEVLQWAHANGCPSDAGTCAAAASGGHLEVLRWLHDVGCEWDQSTCDCAADGGHLGTLQHMLMGRARRVVWTSCGG